MGKLEHYLNPEKLEQAKPYLVPHIFTKNYFKILKKKLNNKKLTYNEQYYYNHFIKKKLKGMMEMFDIEKNINNKDKIKKTRLKKALELIKKYSRKHKNMKILVSGSFLYQEKYNDIDIFIISKYDKEDYREQKVHVNYLPANIENTLFFNSISTISVANFISAQKIEEKIKLNDLLHFYEVTILLMMQKDNYLDELRELVLKAEYISNNVILDSQQLKEITAKIKKSKDPIKILNKYLVVKIINSYSLPILKKVLTHFIKKNSQPEKGQKIYPNWLIYNQTYKEAMEIVA